MMLHGRRLVHVRGAGVPLATCGNMIVHVHVDRRLNAGKLRGIASEPSCDACCGVGTVAVGTREAGMMRVGGHVGCGRGRG